MKRSLLRWGVGLAAVIAVVAAGAMVAVWLVLDSLDLSVAVARVEDAVEQSTGRKLTIGSGPELRFSPSLRVVIRDVTLANMPAGTRAEMLTLKEMQIGLALAPLLTGGKAGLRIALVEPDLLLEANRQGDANWILELSPEEALARLEEAVALLAGRVSLDSVRIENATVRFQDVRAGRTMSAAIRRADLERRPDDRYRIEIEGRVDGEPAAIEAELGLPAAGTTMPVRLSASLAGTAASLEGVVLPAWPSDGTDVKVVMEATEAERLGGIFGVRLGKIPPIKLDAQVTGADGGLRARPLQLSMGRSKLGGDVGVVRFAPRLLVHATLDAPVLDLAAFRDAAGSSGGDARAGQDDGRIFPATRLPLAALHWLDADLRLKVGRLSLPGRSGMEAVDLRLALASGRLRLEPFALASGDGRITGRVRIDAPDSKRAAVQAEAQGEAVELGALLALAGVPESGVRGGRTDFRLNLAASGDSVRTLMATLDGHARVEVGEARLPGKGFDWGGSVLGSVADVVNPYRKTEDGSTVKCVVVNVPVRRGVITVKDTIAGETDKVVGAASGTIDLARETLDLTLSSEAVGGLGPGAADFASAAKITGSLGDPQIGVHAQGAASAGLRLGAAVATGGLTLLAGAVLRQAIPAHPCKVALGG